jgi:hypothetical protein
MTRTRLRIGAAAVATIAGAGLLLLWFESARHALILVGPLDAWQLDFLCALVILASVAAVILSLAHQLSQRDGRIASTLGDVAIVVTVVALALASPGILGLGLAASLQTYTRLAPLDHGKQVVVEEVSFLSSGFAVFRGNGVLFDYVQAPPKSTGGAVILVDHWSVATSNGGYVISYSTTPTGAPKALFTLR